MGVVSREIHENKDFVRKNDLENTVHKMEKRFSKVDKMLDQIYVGKARPLLPEVH